MWFSANSDQTSNFWSFVKAKFDRKPSGKACVRNSGGEGRFHTGRFHTWLQELQCFSQLWVTVFFDTQTVPFSPENSHISFWPIAWLVEKCGKTRRQQLTWTYMNFYYTWTYIIFFWIGEGTLLSTKMREPRELLVLPPAFFVPIFWTTPKRFGEFLETGRVICWDLGRSTWAAVLF